jgi:5-methylcytosine-specific restriction enzyme A
MTTSKPKKVWDKGPNPDRRLQGRAWQKLRARWLQEHPLCVHCEAKGRVRLATVLDHILPRSKGGTEIEENLQGLCKSCDLIKQALDRGYKPRERRRIGLDGWSVPDDE